MKKIFKRASAALLCTLVITTSSLPAMAMGRSYTYNYDYWGDVQDCPDVYNVSRVFTYTELGMENKFSNPNGLYVSGDLIYVCDSGNNRIVVLERTSSESIEYLYEFDSYTYNGSKVNFANPTDLAISEDGFIFVADKGNGRIVKLDESLNCVLEFTKPHDSTIKEDASFNPDKIVVDTAGRVYCEANGINQGLVKYENDATFSGFVGATPVKFDFKKWLWKKFSTQAQREKMISFVPTEYSNIYIDYEGFIYATCSAFEEAELKAEEVDAVRKLNLLGNDILVRNGEWPNYGDLYMGEGGGFSGASRFTDVTVFDNDVYVCLDRNRGRLFGYNDQGQLLYAFGGNGNMDGYFRRPSAIEHMGYDLLVLDSLDCSLTLFVTTEFGELIYEAIDLFDDGNYLASGETWQKVMDQNGNYDRAYIGIGRALLREKRYAEAKEYFEIKYDDENYSKVYKQYRKEWVEDHIVAITIIILVLFLLPMGIGKVKNVKYEIDNADIFK